MAYHNMFSTSFISNLDYQQVEAAYIQHRSSGLHEIIPHFYSEDHMIIYHIYINQEDFPVVGPRKIKSLHLFKFWSVYGFRERKDMAHSGCVRNIASKTSKSISPAVKLHIINTEQSVVDFILKQLIELDFILNATVQHPIIHLHR